MELLVAINFAATKTSVLNALVKSGIKRKDICFVSRIDDFLEALETGQYGFIISEYCIDLSGSLSNRKIEALGNLLWMLDQSISNHDLQKAADIMATTPKSRKSSSLSLEYKLKACNVKTRVSYVPCYSTKPTKPAFLSAAASNRPVWLLNAPRPFLMCGVIATYSEGESQFL